jgi:hypothetical protein
MLIDLHAHYPMQLQPGGWQLTHERIRQAEKNHGVCGRGADTSEQMLLRELQWAVAP